MWLKHLLGPLKTNTGFDILPALKGGDSHIWKAMSGLGIAFQRCLIRCGIGMRLYHSGKLFIQPYQATGFDDQRRIGIPVVRRRAGRARPLPNLQTLSAFRAGSGVAMAALLGGKSFVNFTKPYAGVIALVLQHGSKGAPAGIEHGLGHGRFC